MQEGLGAGCRVATGSKSRGDRVGDAMPKISQEAAGMHPKCVAHFWQRQRSAAAIDVPGDGIQIDETRLLSPYGWDGGIYFEDYDSTKHTSCSRLYYGQCATAFIFRAKALNSEHG